MPLYEGRNPLLWIVNLANLITTHSPWNAPTVRKQTGIDENFQLKGSSRPDGMNLKKAMQEGAVASVTFGIRYARLLQKVRYAGQASTRSSRPTICKRWHLCSSMTPSRCSFRPASSVPATRNGGFLAPVCVFAKIVMGIHGACELAPTLTYTTQVEEGRSMAPKTTLLLLY